MLHYLETYCEINDIQPIEAITELGQFLIENNTTTIKWFSRYSYIVKWFQELLNETITLEEFMTMGDITNKKSVTMPIAPHEACAQIDAWMKVSSDEWKECVVVLDREAFAFCGSDWLESRESELKQLDSKLVVL